MLHVAVDDDCPWRPRDLEPGDDRAAQPAVPPTRFPVQEPDIAVGPVGDLSNDLRCVVVAVVDEEDFGMN
jgi:hypothetical protein